MSSKPINASPNRAITEMKRVLLAIMLVIGSVTIAAAQSSFDLTLRQSDKCLNTLACSDLRDAAYTAAKSHQVAFVTNAYTRANSDQRQAMIIGVEWADANHRSNEFEPLIRSFLATVTEKDRYEDGNWNALQYLADRCDRIALHSLMLGGATRNSESLMKFPISSAEWAATLASFGKCNYRPARDVLTYSLNAASLNAGGAAYDSLQKLYPGVCKHVESPEQAESCYLAYWAKQAKSKDLKPKPSAQN